MRGEVFIGLTKDIIDFAAWPFLTWCRRNSIFPLHLGQKCCALEMASCMNSRWDSERIGILPRSSPRQCDMVLLNGPINKKFAPRIRRLWEQMPDPKWVLAMGNCSISGGPFHESYSMVQGANKVLPVDVYLPGCPPRPEALFRAIEELKGVILEEKPRRAMVITDHLSEIKYLDYGLEAPEKPPRKKKEEEA